MKKIIIASGLLALMGAATSCDKYDIYPEQYGDVMMIKDAGEKEVTVYATDDAAEYSVTVMKGGFAPEDQSSAVLRVMNEEDFEAYKEKYYGDPKFAGLDYLKPEFYTFVDGEGNFVSGYNEETGVVEEGQLVHEFTSAEDRYFIGKIVLNAQEISDWRLAMEATPEGALELNAKKFVIPVGLYSETDSVNADGFYVMIEPVVTDPVLTVSVEHNGYDLTEISRTKLVDDPVFRKQVLEPEVYLEIPCKNNYGFAVKYQSTAGLVNTFNSNNTSVQLANVKNPNDLDYQDDTKWAFKLGTERDGEFVDEIEFPAGVTKVRLPLTFNTNVIDENDLSSNFVKGIQFKPATSGREGIDMVWADDVPEKVKKSLKLPRDPENAAANYVFFVGYKVVETPLELNDGCVTSNDCEPTEGSIGALFDGNLSTFFHSGWTVAFERSVPFASYLEIEVPTNNEVNACYFQFTSRVHSNPQSPKEVHLYYSNEDDPDTRMVDAKAWKGLNGVTADQPNAKPFAEILLKKKLGSGETGEIGSLDNMAIAPEPFKYLRFCVMQNADGKSLTSPSTAVYWNLAELRMYGKYIDPATAE